MRAKVEDGQQYGRLTVIKRADDYVSPKGRHIARFKCKCECGKIFYATSSNILGGRTKGCGCIMHSGTWGRSYIDGRCKERIYHIWTGMKDRCYNKNNQAYKHYGGKGIGLCDEWINDYPAFRTWAIKNGYKSNLTIERIDTDKGYCPENCKWIPRSEQPRNTAQNRWITYNGKTMILVDWAKELGMNSRTLSSRLNKMHLSVEEAFTRPIGRWADG